MSVGAGALNVGRILSNPGAAGREPHQPCEREPFREQSPNGTVTLIGIQWSSYHLPYLLTVGGDEVWWPRTATEFSWQVFLFFKQIKCETKCK